MNKKILLIVAMACCTFADSSVLGQVEARSYGKTALESAQKNDSLLEMQRGRPFADVVLEDRLAIQKKRIIPIIDTEIGSILGGAAVTPSSFYLVDAKETYQYIKSRTGQIGLIPYAPVADYENKRKITGIKLGREDCDNYYTVTLDKPYKGILIGNSTTWQPDYPQPEVLWNGSAGKYWQNATYKKAVADLLKTKGMSDPKVQIVQAKRIDLDGDGTNEVIINASYFRDKSNPFELKRGDYHVVFVRKIVKGEVRNILVEGQFGNGKDFGAVMEHDIYAVLDLEGDGRMEIILHTVVPEGRWSKVFHIEGNGFVEVLRSGCSA